MQKTSIAKSKKKKPSLKKVRRNVMYIHHQQIPLEEGLKAIGETINDPEKAKRYKFGEHQAHTTSIRLRTFFVDGCECYLCKAKGEYFSVDKFASNAEDAPAHINMWGTDPNTKTALLFTHDHVIPKSKGGADNLTNTKTCCVVCNNKKSDSLLSEISS